MASLKLKLFCLEMGAALLPSHLSMQHCGCCWVDGQKYEPLIRPGAKA